ncbi:Secondary metabolism regulator LAE1 [Fusarium oxysporum f. sp. albedinis]|nr:Secondary metabolism regulator LAE1 [Fusarium oxysporum f. sp. albedinis]
MTKKRRARSVLAAILATLEGGGDNLQCSRPGWVSAVTKQSPMQDTEAEESNQVYETVAATLSEMTVSDVYCLFWNDVRSIEVA